MNDRPNRLLLPPALAMGLLLLTVAAQAEPRNSRGPSGRMCATTLTEHDLELVVYGASWCPACDVLDRALEADGDPAVLTLGPAFAGARVRIRHVDVDRATPADLAALRGQGIPEIHVSVAGRILNWHEGACAQADGLRRFVEDALASDGCSVAPGGPAWSGRSRLTRAEVP